MSNIVNDIVNTVPVQAVELNNDVVADGLYDLDENQRTLLEAALLAMDEAKLDTPVAENTTSTLTINPSLSKRDVLRLAKRAQRWLDIPPAEMIVGEKSALVVLGMVEECDHVSLVIPQTLFDDIPLPDVTQLSEAGVRLLPTLTQSAIWWSHGIRVSMLTDLLGWSQANGGHYDAVIAEALVSKNSKSSAKPVTQSAVKKPSAKPVNPPRHKQTKPSDGRFLFAQHVYVGDNGQVIGVPLSQTGANNCSRVSLPTVTVVRNGRKQLAFTPIEALGVAVWSRVAHKDLRGPIDATTSVSLDVVSPFGFHHIVESFGGTPVRALAYTACQTLMGLNLAEWTLSERLHSAAGESSLKQLFGAESMIDFAELLVAKAVDFASRPSYSEREQVLISETIIDNDGVLEFNLESIRLFVQQASDEKLFDGAFSHKVQDYGQLTWVFVRGMKRYLDTHPMVIVDLKDDINVWLV